MYSLGVMAYRLLAGKYPKHGEPRQEEAGLWRWEAVAPAAPHVLNPRVDSRLSALCLHMLSVHPEARGTAVELAEALEQAAEHPDSLSAEPLFVAEPVPTERAAKAPAPEEPAVGRGPAALPYPHKSALAGSQWLAVAAALLTMGSWVGWVGTSKSEKRPSVVQPEAAGAGQRDEAPTGLGEAASTTSVEDSSGSSVKEVLAEEPLPEPQPGQARPDAKGRCPGKQQVALDGGCWKRLNLNLEECGDLSGHLFKDACYVPSAAPRRPPTSSPTHKP